MPPALPSRAGTPLRRQRPGTARRPTVRAKAGQTWWRGRVLTARRTGRSRRTQPASPRPPEPEAASWAGPAPAGSWLPLAGPAYRSRARPAGRPARPLRAQHDDRAGREDREHDRDREGCGRLSEPPISSTTCLPSRKYWPSPRSGGRTAASRPATSSRPPSSPRARTEPLDAPSQAARGPSLSRVSS